MPRTVNMKPHPSALIGLIAWLGLADATAAPLSLPARDTSKPAALERSESFGKLPLIFEANRGRADARFDFFSRGDSYSLLLNGSEAVLLLHPPRNPEAAAIDSRWQAAPRPAPPPRDIHLHLVGASTEARLSGEEASPTRINYLSGADVARWSRNVPAFGKVRSHELYPGVDLVFYGNQRQLEYDFVIAPGADPAQISLRFTGADRVELEAGGDLLLRVGDSSLRQHKPVAYQMIGGERRPVAASFKQQPDGTIEFELGKYDLKLPLTIDPVLSYSTLLGGAGRDRAWGLAVDAAGNAYVAGETISVDFRTTTNAFQTNFAGGSDEAGDAFVGKLNDSGTNFIYLTYLGGSSHDGALALAVDSAGSAYVAGFTDSQDFPTTTNAFRRSVAGSPSQYFSFYPFDGFVAKLGPDGSTLLYSTFLGGDLPDQALALAIDTAGKIYVAGFTKSLNFPVTAGAAQATLSGSTNGINPLQTDAFVAKFDPALNGTNSLVWATYLGGFAAEYAEGIGVDSAGNVFVTGETLSTNFPVVGALQTTNAGNYDVFLAKLNPTGTALLFSTYLGGSAEDRGLRLATDSGGNAYVTGRTSSTNFPVANAVQSTNAGLTDAILLKVDSSGTSLVYSTYLGGSFDERGWDIFVDSNGAAYIVGQTTSTNFLPAGGIQSTNAGTTDAFMLKLSPSGATIEGGTYFGGQGLDYGYAVTVDTAGGVYMAGQTLATFPTTTNAFQRFSLTSDGDAWIAKCLLEPVLTVNASEGQFVITWAAPTPEFALETSASVSGPWTAVSQTPTVIANRNTVTLPASGNPQFFRLRRVR